MAEERRVLETKLSREEAYAKCFKRASHLGLNVTIMTKGHQLEVRETRRTAGWWTAVILGFIFYIIPGILVLVFWKPIDYCSLMFDDSAEGCLVTATLKGERGRRFFSEVAGLLM